ncbi:glycosyltransferase [Aerococcaceae bacterium DSM 111021]|nr:glycosyltransferase [Aerococcaceae bacterium DSM 111021]
MSEYKKYNINQQKAEIATIFKKRTGQNLDWENLVTYNEKMQWAKLFDKNPLKTRLSDKYLVREWVENKIGSEYLIDLLGVWNNFEEIEFDELPNKFVLKTTNASATNVIVHDKKKVKKIGLKFKFNRWLKSDHALLSFELHYSDIQPKIIAEKFINDSNNQLNDYRFLCFAGKPYYCTFDDGSHEGHHRNIYDMEWNIQDFQQGNFTNTETQIPKPKNFDKMIEIATILSEGFPHVRVDLYNVDGKIYFGEMTFTNSSGFQLITPHKINEELGQLWELPTEDIIE